jgi:predicted amidohydrolase YtcJ
MLRVIGIKMFLDGGMLTGSAYMRQPWGVSATYGITDPNYRGVLFIPRERLLPIVRTTIESGLQFTAHSVGDGAVLTLLEVYEEVNKTTPVAPVRPCVTHSNFMSREAVDQLVRLGGVVDIQPIWLWLDAHTLLKQFGYERLRYFQPLKTIFDAGGVAGAARITCRRSAHSARSTLTTRSWACMSRSRGTRAGPSDLSTPKRH